MRSKINSVLNNPQARLTIQQFVTFAGVGAIGTAGHYLTLILLVQAFDVIPVTASSVGFLVGAVINYILNYRYTFRSDKRHSEAMLKFFIVAAIGAALNGFIMYLGTEVGDIHYLLVQIGATGTVVFFTFVLNRLWTFAE
ncbi:MAG: GtrA family protein [Gammaproteobacteria bacterium]|jgi:putative flippase GtrA